MYRVGVVGLGYVGLCTGAVLAKKLEVVGLDVDARKVKSLRKGMTAIPEKGLQQLLKWGLDSGRLSFTSDYNELAGSDFVFIAVGTPSLTSGEIDLRHVESSAASIGKAIRGSGWEPVIVMKSTVVPGTTDGVVTGLLETHSGKRVGKDFEVCSNPEFLREGSAIQDTLNPDRIVIGSRSRKGSRRLEAFWRAFYGRKAPLFVVTDNTTAELVKYSSNAFLATKISFINFISRIAEKFPGCDVNVVAKAMGLDPRIGPSFLEAGPGYGGSCFPKDLKALIAFSEALGLDPGMINSVDMVNETQPQHVLSLAEGTLGGLQGKRVAILGLAFKAGTSDVRESRSIVLARLFLSHGAELRVYDPRATDEARRFLGDSVAYTRSAMDCIRGSDVAVVMNAESEFRRLKPAEFLKHMRRATVLDTRRIYDPGRFSMVELFQLGRGVAKR